MALKFPNDSLNLKAQNILVNALLCITIFVAFLPLNPFLPGVDLGSSWEFGLNQAYAQKLVFGKDIVFTFGPYSSVYTRLYHPATDTLMLLGSLFFMTCFSLLLISQIKVLAIRWRILLIAIFASGYVILDAIFFLYLLLLVYSTLSFIRKIHYGSKRDNLSNLIFILFFSPLGLILLIKGNFLIITMIILFLCMIMLWLYGFKTISVGIITIVIASTVFLWLIANQPLSAIFAYFANLIPIVGGYSESMAYWGGPYYPYEIAGFGITSFCILMSLIGLKNITKIQKYFLLIGISFLLFIVFKSSFVRHDKPHALIASSFILILGITLALHLQKTRLYFCLFVTLLTWGLMQYKYTGINLIKHIGAVYSNFAHGLELRLNGELSKDYKKRMAMIATSSSFPVLTGTTDIYSTGQTMVIASGNKWNPRPIIQSYSAYTPALAEKNANHLKGSASPENLIFRIEPIDEKLPSLEDGLSWPIIINNYTFQSTIDSFLFLKRKPIIQGEFKKHELFCGDFHFNEQIIVPDTTSILFIKIELSETIFGKMLSAIYKPQELLISVELTDNRKKEYRLIANMAKSGFILSPLIETTEEFGFFFEDMDKLENQKVRSFCVALRGRKNKFNSWNKLYHVCVNRIVFDN